MLGPLKNGDVLHHVMAQVAEPLYTKTGL